MLNFFRKKTKSEILQKKYQKLLSESHKISQTNRTLSDQKLAEADTVLKEIEALEKEGN
jgi:chaperonin cofactor prefoldin